MQRAATDAMKDRLDNCATDAQARVAFADAIDAGAPFDAVIDAMREWCETHAADVQRVQSAAVTS